MSVVELLRRHPKKLPQMGSGMAVSVTWSPVVLVGRSMATVPNFSSDETGTTRPVFAKWAMKVATLGFWRSVLVMVTRSVV